MTREEAQNILELIRPGRAEDREDPLVQEALELLSSDDDLEARFRAAQETDARIGSEISSISVPAELKSEILVGMRAHAKAVKGNTVPFEAPAETTPSRTWWQQPWIAAAACFVIILGIALSVRNDGTDLAQGQTTANHPVVAQAGLPSFIPFLSQQINSLGGFDQTSTNPTELISFLTDKGDPSPLLLPGKLPGMQSIGCVTFHYGETEFSMICFNKDKVYHLLTADIDDMEHAPPATPQTYEYNGQAFRVWTEGDQVMILTCPGSSEYLKDII